MTAPPVPLTFTIAGFSKCGTTTLSAVMGQHPDVLLPEVKEPWFFSWDDYADGWPTYAAQFPHADRYRAVGDDSTTYTAHQFTAQTAERLHRHYPELRVLVIARDPVDRIESAFRESHHSSHRYGVLTPFRFEDALEQSPGLVQDSRYWHCIAPYLDHFPADQVRVVFLEDLVRDPVTTVAECLAFVGVDPGRGDLAIPHLNEGSSKYRDTRLVRAMRSTPGTRSALARIPFDRQEKWLRSTRLRVPNDGPLQWDATSRQILRSQVLPDARQFLERFGEGRSWRRLESLCSG